MSEQSEGKAGNEQAGSHHAAMQTIDPFVLMTWNEMEREDENKKKLFERILEEKMMVMRHTIRLLEYKIETLELVKSMVEEA